MSNARGMIVVAGYMTLWAWKLMKNIHLRKEIIFYFALIALLHLQTW